MNPTLGKTRAKHTRSRTGCGVCRVRRVRCDESRPACRKCTSTGRTCDGYPSQQRSRPDLSGTTLLRSPVKIGSKNATIPWAALYEPAGYGEIECRLLRFYENRTASELDGDFQDDFWRRLVLQVSHRVPCVRHAVLGLTYLHIVHCIKEQHPPASQPAEATKFELHATYFYSKAVELLNHHISSNKWASLEETLLCCVLCIRFEWIAGNRAAALIHLRSSLEILRQWRTATSSPSPTPTSFWSPGGYLIRTTISPMYMRLALEASMLANEAGSVPLPPPPPEPVGSLCFVTLKDARDSLYDILGDEHLNRRPFNKQKKESSPTIRNLSTLERFNQWSISLATLFRQVDVENCGPTPATLALRIWHKIVRIMLENKGNDDECVFDAYSDDFAEAIDLAAKMQALKTSNFSADTSINAALFYAAIKCRHPETRRRAIALLEGSPRDEEIWHSALAVRLASHIVEREEMAAGCTVHTENDVPRAARINAKVYTWEEERD